MRRVEYFVSRGAMDIDGFGSKTGALLAEVGMVKDLAEDIYYLDRDQLLALEGFRTEKVNNLLDGLAASKNQSPVRFLTALGIRFVGNVVAGLLIGEFGSIDNVSSRPGAVGGSRGMRRERPFPLPPGLPMSGTAPCWKNSAPPAAHLPPKSPLRERVAA